MNATSERGLPPTMSAARLHRRSGPEVMAVESAPMPFVGPGDVLVEVRAAGES